MESLRMEWEVWRSREVVKAKKRETPQGERYYTSEGKQYDAEVFKERFEKVETHDPGT